MFTIENENAFPCYGTIITNIQMRLKIRLAYTERPISSLSDMNIICVKETSRSGVVTFIASSPFFSEFIELYIIA